MLPGILSSLRVAGCVSPTLSLVDVSAARESSFQSYQGQVLELPLSPEAFRGKLIFRERGGKVPACLTVIRTLSGGLEK